MAQRDLARACRAHCDPKPNRALRLMAELAIIVCDVTEVLGSASALHLPFGVYLLTGILITAFYTVVVLGLMGHGFRQIEAIVLGLVVTIGACFAVQLMMASPDSSSIMAGFIPRAESLRHPEMLCLSIGILGATVMPHNLYLHSSIVQTRRAARDEDGRRDALPGRLELSVAFCDLAAHSPYRFA